MLEPEPCTHALRAFLTALPDEVLYSIVALMYSGRDHEGDVVDYWNDLRVNSITSRDEAVGAILEKAPRMEYIGIAIGALPVGTQLNDLPRLIAAAE